MSLTLRPQTADEYATWREGVVERRAAHPRMRGLSVEHASARAREMVDRHLPPGGPPEGTEVLAVVDGDGRRAGAFFLQHSGSAAADLGDLVLRSASDAPAVRDLLAVRLRAGGTRTLSLGVRRDDPVATAFVADHASEVVATQMQLDLTAPRAVTEGQTEPQTERSRVAVRPMTEDELAAYFASAVEDFAEETMRSDPSLSREEALESSREIHAQILPQGLDSPGHDFLVALDARDGRRVGFTWLFHEDRAGFVYDVEVQESERGRGYGRALMVHAQDRVRELGMEVLGLNVFGHNQVARDLYVALGYQVVDESLVLPLADVRPR